MNELAYQHDFTLILCWSDLEAARYLELYKVYEKRSANSLKSKLEDEYLPRLQDTLSTVKPVNSTDVLTLATNFGSLKSIMTATTDELSICAGFGEKKVKRLHETFHASFSKKSTINWNHQQQHKMQGRLDLYIKTPKQEKSSLTLIKTKPTIIPDNEEDDTTNEK